MKRLAVLLTFLVVSAVPVLVQEKPLEEKKVDVTGEWEMSVESPQGAMSIAATYKQDGEVLSGKHVSEMGEVPLAGTVKGSQISYTIVIDVQGQQLSIAHQGKVEGDTITGTADLGGMGTISWSARRKK